MFTRRDILKCLSVIPIVPLLGRNKKPAEPTSQHRLGVLRVDAIDATNPPYWRAFRLITDLGREWTMYAGPELPVDLVKVGDLLSYEDRGDYGWIKSEAISRATRRRYSAGKAGWIIALMLLALASPAFAADHSLLSAPVRQAVNTAQQVRQAPRPPAPDLEEGDYWICSVGQRPAVNSQAMSRAKEQGWGFWSFAPHAKCPAGVYLAVVDGGTLRNTGGNPWSDEPTQNVTSAVTAPSGRSYTRQSAAGPTASPAVYRYAESRPVYYEPPVTYYAQPVSYGSPYGSACSTGDCGGSSGYAQGYYGVGTGCTYGGTSWSNGSSGSFSGGSGCASCQGR